MFRGQVDSTFLLEERELKAVARHLGSYYCEGLHDYPRTRAVSLSPTRPKSKTCGLMHNAMPMYVIPRMCKAYVIRCLSHQI